jgi:hypothetical protein
MVLVEVVTVRSSVRLCFLCYQNSQIKVLSFLFYVTIPLRIIDVIFVEKNAKIDILCFFLIHNKLTNKLL